MKFVTTLAKVLTRKTLTLWPYPFQEEPQVRDEDSWVRCGGEIQKWLVWGGVAYLRAGIIPSRWRMKGNSHYWNAALGPDPTPTTALKSNDRHMTRV